MIFLKTITRAFHANPETLCFFSATSLLAIQLFLYLPRQIYAANHIYFAFIYTDHLSSLAIYFLGTMLFFTIIWILFSRILRFFLSRFLLTLSLVTWVISVLVTHEFGQFDGNEWQRFAETTNYIRGEIEILAFITLGFVIVQLKPKSINNLSLFCLILSAGSLITATTTPQVEVIHKQPLESEKLFHSLNQYSDSTNVLIFVFDGFQSELFADAVKFNGWVETLFDDFVYYPDTLAASEYTVLSLPLLLTGKGVEWWHPNPLIYARTAVNESFIHELTQSGYVSHFVSDDAVTSYFCPNRHPHEICASAREFLTTKSRARFNETLSLIDISLLRLAPVLSKESIRNNGNWIFQATFGRPLYPGHENYSPELQRTQSGNLLLEKMSMRMDFSSPHPVIKFIHILSTHAPYSIGPDCAINPNGVNATLSGHRDQAVCALRKLRLFIDKFRASHAYDNSLIAVVADNGSAMSLDQKGYASSIARKAGANRNMAALIGSANPLLAIKYPNAKGKLRTDYRPVDLTDLPKTICNTMGGCYPASGRDIRSSNLARERTFAYFPEGHPRQDEHIVRYIKYAVNGPVWQPESWSNPISHTRSIP